MTGGTEEHSFRSAGILLPVECSRQILTNHTTTAVKAQHILESIACMQDFEAKDWKAGTWLLLQLKHTKLSVDDVKSTVFASCQAKRECSRYGET